MKLIITLFSMLFSSLITFSQFHIPIGSKSELTKFYQSKTYIVLKNDIFSDYNTAMKDAAEKFWKISKFEFINESEFQKQRQDNSKAFLVINQVYFEKDKSNTLFDFLILTIGGKYRTINDMPTLCAIPLAYNGANEEDYVYKLGLMLKFIQKHIETSNNNPGLNSESILTYYLNQSGSSSEKTLHVLQNEIEIDIRSQYAFKNEYPGNFKFSSKEEIKSLINNSDSNALILHKIGPQPNSKLSRCIKFVMDTKNADIYYFNQHNINKKNANALLKSDLRNLYKK